MKDAIAINLKLLRSEKRQDQWAEELGVNKMTISAWERGLRWPKQSQLQHIAEKFNLKVGDLFREDLFTNGTIIRDPKAEYAADLTAAYTNSEIQDTVRLLWKWKKEEPVIDIPHFMKQLYALPDDKQKLAIQLIETMT